MLIIDQFGQKLRQPANVHSACLPACLTLPTKHFSISEPQHPVTSVREEQKNGRLADFEALKSWNARSGTVESPSCFFPSSSTHTH